MNLSTAFMLSLSLYLLLMRDFSDFKNREKHRNRCGWLGAIIFLIAIVGNIASRKYSGYGFYSAATTLTTVDPILCLVLVFTIWFGIIPDDKLRKLEAMDDSLGRGKTRKKVKK